MGARPVSFPGRFAVRAQSPQTGQLNKDSISITVGDIGAKANGDWQPVLPVQETGGGRWELLRSDTYPKCGRFDDKGAKKDQMMGGVYILLEGDRDSSPALHGTMCEQIFVGG